MSNKILTKIILDIVMTVVFLILIDPQNTGMTFHEIAGLAMGALFVFHIILNWTWVRSVTKNLFNPKLKNRTKFFYILNAISFISVVTIIFTGVEISQVLFASQSGSVSESFYILHKWVSYFCLGLFSVHIVLHRRFIKDVSLKLLAALKAPALSKAVISTGIILLMASLLYSQIATGPNDNENQYNISRESYNYRREAYQSEFNENKDNTAAIDNDTTYEYPIKADDNTSVDSESTTQDNQNSSISSDTDSNGDKITLADYLGNLFCNGCHNHCSLLNLQCNRGLQQLEEAKIEYQQEYGSTGVN